MIDTPTSQVPVQASAADLQRIVDEALSGGDEE
jgi:hypothetical protein